MNSAVLPLELPRLVMRRTLAIAVAAMAALVALGLVRTGFDIRDEVAGATALAETVASLGNAAAAGDEAALAALAATQRERPLRHLQLKVEAADGRLLLAPAAPREPAGLAGPLLALHRALLPGGDPRVTVWTLPRPPAEAGGRPGGWRVSLIASPETERGEALLDLAVLLLLVVGAIVALLLAMRWNVQRAFRPLAAIVRAIEGIERRDAGAVHALPRMPIRELQTIANAIVHLESSLRATEQERQRLGRRLVTLQEDERARLARELHDEFGQRLTALRVDAAWLGKRSGDDDRAVRDVVRGMAERCGELQRDIRGLLARLRPLGPAEIDDETPTLDRLLGLLRGLVDGWQSSARGDDRVYALHALRLGDDGQARPIDEADAARIAMPREWMLAIYRLSQEALTNVARHAQAHRVELRLVVSRRADGQQQLEWSVRDDGVGVADLGAAMRQGNGLGGMRERVWALGSELRCGAANDDGRGFALDAVLQWAA